MRLFRTNAMQISWLGLVLHWIFSNLVFASPSWMPTVPCDSSSSGYFDFNQSNGGSYSNFYKAVSQGQGRDHCYKEWSVLVFIAADNDLTPYALADIYEMEAAFTSGQYAGSTKNLDLIVSLDSASKDGIKRFHMFQSKRPFLDTYNKDDFAKWSESSIQSPIVMTKPEIKSGSFSGYERELSDFLEWGMRAYPAKNTMVVLWGHGQGWLTKTKSNDTLSPTNASADKPSPTDDELGDMLGAFKGRASGISNLEGKFGFNDSSKVYLPIPAIKRVLKHIRDDVLDHEPISLYVSDACLMQMLEVATEIAPYSRFISGSTQVQDYVGLPYRRLIYEMNRGSYLSIKSETASKDLPFLVSKMIPRIQFSSFNHGYQYKLSQAGLDSMTMSSLSSEELLRSVVPAFRIFSYWLNTFEKSLTDDELLEFRKALIATPSMMGGARDVMAFLTSVEGFLANQSQTEIRATLKVSIEFLDSALDRAVVEHAMGRRYRQDPDLRSSFLTSKAVSMWLPRDLEDFSSRIDSFSESSFYKKQSGFMAEAWKTLFGADLGDLFGIK